MAHDDLNALVNWLVRFAEEMLERYGEFYPFGATISASGELAAAAAHAREDRPDSAEIIELMRATFRRQTARGELRAAGYCFDSFVIPPGEHDKRDAITCRLETGDEAVMVYVLYQIVDGGVHLDPPFHTDAEPELFEARSQQ